MQRARSATIRYSRSSRSRSGWRNHRFKAGDLLLVLGAGNITQVATDVLARLA
jgi:hypothetical protein